LVDRQLDFEPSRRCSVTEEKSNENEGFNRFGNGPCANPLSPDVRLIQNGPSIDGWTPPARGRRNSTEEPTIGIPGGRGRRGGGGR